jgi:acyl-CoA synthetase (AMP-forming)/AMP-acid ligase II
MTNERSKDVAHVTIVERLRQRVQQTPDGHAFYVLTGDSRWHAVTWAAYAERVERVAAALSASGIVRGNRVAI